MADPTRLRLSELKRALRWLRAQYERRAGEAARGEDRTIERIRRSKAQRAGEAGGPYEAADGAEGGGSAGSGEEAR
jgi:hypothetical protein